MGPLRSSMGVQVMKIEAILATVSLRLITIRPDQVVREAVGLLAEHDVGALVVVDEPGQPLGIISERDIVREASRSGDFLAQPVGRLMSSDLVTVSPEDDVEPVIQVMIARHIRHLPVIDQQGLIGVVSMRDVLKAHLGNIQGEVDTLQTRIMEEQS